MTVLNFMDEVDEAQEFPRSHQVMSPEKRSIIESLIEVGGGTAGAAVIGAALGGQIGAIIGGVLGNFAMRKLGSRRGRVQGNGIGRVRPH